MKKLFKWLLIKVVVGALVLALFISVVVSLILWFLMWPFVYFFKLISVNVDKKGRFISKKDWNDWIA
jgi:hypothetical protein